MGKEETREAISELEETENGDLAAADEGSESGNRDAGENPVSVLEKRLEAAKEEAAQFYDRFLRTVAEFDNYRKRTSREMDTLRKYANEALLRDLLSAVDNLERAIQSSGDGDDGHPVGSSVVEGIDMTLKELLRLLEKYQVTPLDAEGKPFDPAFHQAFMTQATAEHPENTVLKVMQKGYLLHDRLLRPAMVVVSKAPSDPSADDSGNDD